MESPRLSESASHEITMRHSRRGGRDVRYELCCNRDRGGEGELPTDFERIAHIMLAIAIYFCKPNSSQFIALM